MKRGQLGSLSQLLPLIYIFLYLGSYLSTDFILGPLRRRGHIRTKLQGRKEKRQSRDVKEYFDNIGKIGRIKLEEKIATSYTNREISGPPHAAKRKNC